MLYYLFLFILFIAHLDIIIKYITRGILKLLGFTINLECISKIPKKCVIIPANHTSNWDGIILLLYYFAYLNNIKIIILVKEELEKVFGTFGKKYFGFLYIDRNVGGIVKSIISLVRDKSEYSIMIAPEGTRKLTKGMKTGFWYIAHELNIEICMVCFCYNKKSIENIFVIKPSNIKEDFKKIESEAVKYIPLYKECSYLHTK